MDIARTQGVATLSCLTKVTRMSVRCWAAIRVKPVVRGGAVGKS